MTKELRISKNQKNQIPLGELVRPHDYHGLMGQEHIWGLETPLRKMVERDRFYSLIFWGPPGTGKTTLAKIIGQQSLRQVVILSAVSASVKEIRQVLSQSQEKVDEGEKSLLLFMDEIHRLTKSQQDVFLPALESGVIRFMGATTENPSFEVNKAILSRSLVFPFQKVSPPKVCEILSQAMTHEKFPYSQLEIDKEVVKVIADQCHGDVRKAFNFFEAVICSRSHKEKVSLHDLKNLGDHLGLPFDKNGDEHYDLISALIKSIRASHPDAALYYLARLIKGGEDLSFLVRRLIIVASEDVGNANPHAITIANSSAQAIERVGMPEARIILGQLCTFLASSPKSNRSYLAMDRALSDVKQKGPLDIPPHLVNAPTDLMKDMGRSSGYIYPHDDLPGARDLSYLPKEIKGRKYYEPSSFGYEEQIQRNLERLRPRRD